MCRDFEGRYKREFFGTISIRKHITKIDNILAYIIFNIVIEMRKLVRTAYGKVLHFIFIYVYSHLKFSALSVNHF